MILRSNLSPALQGNTLSPPTTFEDVFHDQDNRYNQHRHSDNTNSHGLNPTQHRGMAMTSPDLADHGPAIHPATPEMLAKPPWAGFIWTDDHNLWLELPCPVGKAPAILQYPLTEGGLGKALNLLVQCANIKRDPPPAGWFRYGEAKPKVSKPASPKLAAQPQVLQDAVQRALRKARLI